MSRQRHAMPRHILRGLALAILAVGGGAGAALAGPIVVTTTGTVTTGSDFAANSLAGDPYSLTLVFAGLGSSTFSSANDASTQGGLLGSAVASVGGRSYSASITEDFGSLIDETPFAITAQLVGDDAAQQVTDASVSLDSASGGFGVPNLSGGISYVALPGDSGLDSFAFTNAAGLTVSFTGTPHSLAVPEPASGTALAVGLGALALARWPRRRARYDS